MGYPLFGRVFQYVADVGKLAADFLHQVDRLDVSLGHLHGFHVGIHVVTIRTDRAGFVLIDVGAEFIVIALGIFKYVAEADGFGFVAGGFQIRQILCAHLSLQLKGVEAALHGVEGF